MENKKDETVGGTSLGRGLNWFETEESGEREGESSVRLHRACEQDTVEFGIRYQKCGGGRRIIRRQHGGNY